MCRVSVDERDPMLVHRLARYRATPPFLLISRQIVDGDLLSSSAIWRIEWLLARPRDIASRSSELNELARLTRWAGWYPPNNRSIPKIEAVCLPSSRPISLNDSPLCQRFQTSAFSSSLSPGLPSLAITHPSVIFHQVLCVALTS